MRDLVILGTSRDPFAAQDRRSQWVHLAYQSHSRALQKNAAAFLDGRGYHGTAVEPIHRHSRRRFGRLVALPG
jgi:hypothetical protein